MPGGRRLELWCYCKACNMETFHPIPNETDTDLLNWLQDHWCYAMWNRNGAMAQLHPPKGDGDLRAAIRHAMKQTTPTPDGTGKE